MPIGKRLVDDSNPRRRGRVILLNQPATKQPNRQRVERLRIDFVDVRKRFLSAFRRGAADNREWLIPDIDRKVADDAGTSDARYRAHAIEDLIVEDLDLR